MNKILRVLLYAFLIITSMFIIFFVSNEVDYLMSAYDYAKTENIMWAESYPIKDSDPYAHNFGVAAFYEKKFAGIECFNYLFQNAKDIKYIEYYDDKNKLDFSSSDSFLEFYKSNSEELDENSYEVFILGINKDFYIDKIAIAKANLNKTKKLGLNKFYDDFEENTESYYFYKVVLDEKTKSYIVGIILGTDLLILNILFLIFAIKKKKKFTKAVIILLVVINFLCLCNVSQYYLEVNEPELNTIEVIE